MKFSFRKGKNLIIFIVGVSLILALNFFQKEVKNSFYFISSPIQKILWQAGAKTYDFFETVFEIKNLKRENETLKSKNQELISENIILKELKRENEDLRKALEIDLKKDFDLILSDVIGKDALQDAILINKGYKDGISENLPVITSQKTLLGKIDEVYKNFSRVLLISDKNSSFNTEIIALELFGETTDKESAEFKAEAQGVVRGEGNFRVILDLVSRETEIKAGDLVLTTGSEGIFPKGLLVGKIKKVQKDDIAPFRKAEIEPAFDIKGLNKVFIITNF